MADSEEVELLSSQHHFPVFQGDVSKHFYPSNFVPISIHELQEQIDYHPPIFTILRHEKTNLFLIKYNDNNFVVCQTIDEVIQLIKTLRSYKKHFSVKFDIASISDKEAEMMSSIVSEQYMKTERWIRQQRREHGDSYLSSVSEDEEEELSDDDSLDPGSIKETSAFIALFPGAITPQIFAMEVGNENWEHEGVHLDKLSVVHPATVVNQCLDHECNQFFERVTIHRDPKTSMVLLSFCTITLAFDTMKDLRAFIDSIIFTLGTKKKGKGMFFNLSNSLTEEDVDAVSDLFQEEHLKIEKRIRAMNGLTSSVKTCSKQPRKADVLIKKVGERTFETTSFECFAFEMDERDGDNTIYSMDIIQTEPDSTHPFEVNVTDETAKQHIGHFCFDDCQDIQNFIEAFHSMIGKLINVFYWKAKTDAFDALIKALIKKYARSSICFNETKADEVCSSSTDLPHNTFSVRDASSGDIKLMTINAIRDSLGVCSTENDRFVFDIDEASCKSFTTTIKCYISFPNNTNSKRLMTVGFNTFTGLMIFIESFIDAISSFVHINFISTKEGKPHDSFRSFLRGLRNAPKSTISCIIFNPKNSVNSQVTDIHNMAPQMKLMSQNDKKVFEETNFESFFHRMDDGRDKEKAIYMIDIEENADEVPYSVQVKIFDAHKSVDEDEVGSFCFHDCQDLQSFVVLFFKWIGKNIRFYHWQPKTEDFKLFMNEFLEPFAKQHRETITVSNTSESVGPLLTMRLDDDRYAVIAFDKIKHITSYQKVIFRIDKTKLSPNSKEFGYRCKIEAVEEQNSKTLIFADCYQMEHFIKKFFGQMCGHLEIFFYSKNESEEINSFLTFLDTLYESNPDRITTIRFCSLVTQPAKQPLKDDVAPPSSSISDSKADYNFPLVQRSSFNTYTECSFETFAASMKQKTYRLSIIETQPGSKYPFEIKIKDAFDFKKKCGTYSFSDCDAMQRFLGSFYDKVTKRFYITHWKAKSNAFILFVSGFLTPFKEAHYGDIQMSMAENWCLPPVYTVRYKKDGKKSVSFDGLRVYLNTSPMPSTYGMCIKRTSVTDKTPNGDVTVTEYECDVYHQSPSVTVNTFLFRKHEKLQKFILRFIDHISPLLVISSDIEGSDEDTRNLRAFLYDLGKDDRYNVTCLLTQPLPLNVAEQPLKDDPPVNCELTNQIVAVHEGVIISEIHEEKVINKDDCQPAPSCSSSVNVARDLPKYHLIEKTKNGGFLRFTFDTLVTALDARNDKVTVYCFDILEPEKNAPSSFQINFYEESKEEPMHLYFVSCVQIMDFLTDFFKHIGKHMWINYWNTDPITFHSFVYDFLVNFEENLKQTVKVTYGKQLPSPPFYLTKSDQPGIGETFSLDQLKAIFDDYPPQTTFKLNLRREAHSAFSDGFADVCEIMHRSTVTPLKTFIFSSQKKLIAFLANFVHYTNYLFSIFSDIIEEDEEKRDLQTHLCTLVERHPLRFAYYHSKDSQLTGYATSSGTVCLPNAMNDDKSPLVNPQPNNRVLLKLKDDNYESIPFRIFFERTDIRDLLSGDIEIVEKWNSVVVTGHKLECLVKPPLNRHAIPVTVCFRSDEETTIFFKELKTHAKKCVRFFFDPKVPISILTSISDEFDTSAATTASSSSQAVIINDASNNGKSILLQTPVGIDHLVEWCKDDQSEETTNKTPSSSSQQVEDDNDDFSITWKDQNGEMMINSAYQPFRNSRWPCVGKSFNFLLTLAENYEEDSNYTFQLKITELLDHRAFPAIPVYLFFHNLAELKRFVIAFHRDVTHDFVFNEDFDDNEGIGRAVKHFIANEILVLPKPFLDSSVTFGFPTGPLLRNRVHQVFTNLAGQAEINVEIIPFDDITNVITCRFFLANDGQFVFDAFFKDVVSMCNFIQQTADHFGSRFSKSIKLGKHLRKGECRTIENQLTCFSLIHHVNPSSSSQPDDLNVTWQIDGNSIWSTESFVEMRTRAWLKRNGTFNFSVKKYDSKFTPTLKEYLYECKITEVIDGQVSSRKAQVVIFQNLDDFKRFVAAFRKEISMNIAYGYPFEIESFFLKEIHTLPFDVLDTSVDASFPNLPQTDAYRLREVFRVLGKDGLINLAVHPATILAHKLRCHIFVNKQISHSVITNFKDVSSFISFVQTMANHFKERLIKTIAVQETVSHQDCCQMKHSLQDFSFFPFKR
jgi:hypothetical protein